MACGVGRDQVRRRACRAPWPGCRRANALGAVVDAAAARCTRVPAAGMKPERQRGRCRCGAASRSSSTQSMPASRSSSAAVRPQAPAPTMATGTCGVPARHRGGADDAGCGVMAPSGGRAGTGTGRAACRRPCRPRRSACRAGRSPRRAPTARAPRTACSPASTASPWRGWSRCCAGSTSAMSASKPSAMSPLLFRPKRCAGFQLVTRAMWL